MNMRNAVSPLLHSALAIRRHIYIYIYMPPSTIIGGRFSLAALQKFVTAERKYPSLTGLLASVDVKQQSLSPWSHASLQLPQRKICRVANVHFQCNAQQLHSLVVAVTGGSDWLSATLGESLVAATLGESHLVAATLGESHLVAATLGESHLVAATHGESHLVAATLGESHLVAATLGESNLVAVTHGESHLFAATLENVGCLSFLQLRKPCSQFHLWKATCRVGKALKSALL